NVTGRARTHHAGMAALGLKCEESIKGGNAVNAAGRQLEMPRDEVQQIQFQVAEELLGRVQHFEQRVVAVLMALHGYFQQLEAPVPASVPGRFLGFVLGCVSHFGHSSWTGEASRKFHWTPPSARRMDHPSGLPPVSVPGLMRVPG